MSSSPGNEEGSFSRIGGELLRRTVLYGILFILVSAGISVFVAYNREQNRVEELLTRIRTSELGPLAEALWVADTEMLQLQLESLTRHPLVAYARVDEQESLVASAGAEPPGRVEREAFPLEFLYNDQLRTIGELTVTVSLRPVYRNAIESGLLGSLYPIAAILAVGFLIYSSFHTLVIRRLLSITTYLRAFEAAAEMEPLELPTSSRRKPKGDELDDMARIINEMRERLVGHRQELEAAYTQVEREVQEKTRELQLANQTLKRQIDALERTKRELTEADRTKTMFLANMSHELRTPISGIVGLARLLERTELDAVQRDYLRSILSSGRALLDIVEDLLDFGRIEAGSLEITEDTFSIEELLEEVVTLLGPTAERQNCTVNTSVEATLSGEYRGDAVRIAQVLRNLLSNALKFAPSGVVTVAVEQVSTEGGVTTVRFSVRDNGIGISEAELPRLFESFYQVDSSYSKKHEGTGLGLAISRRLVAMMGGEISVVSTLGDGSTFSFELPLRRVDDGTPLEELKKEGSGSAEEQAASEAGELKILLAEDNAINRLYVERFLQGEGHRVEAVADGSEAVEAARTGAFDLILMDVQMPGMDGLEATRRIREFSEVPVVALTAYARPEEIESFYAEGMNAAVTKPINEAQLRKAIAETS